eukprot:symbB.v1.2.025980.t1/scaffold2555.1/size76423/1
MEKGLVADCQLCTAYEGAPCLVCLPLSTDLLLFKAVSAQLARRLAVRAAGCPQAQLRNREALPLFPSLRVSQAPFRRFHASRSEAEGEVPKNKDEDKEASEPAEAWPF